MSKKIFALFVLIFLGGSLCSMKKGELQQKELVDSQGDGQQGGATKKTDEKQQIIVLNAPDSNRKKEEARLFINARR